MAEDLDNPDRMSLLFANRGIHGTANDFLTMLWSLSQFFDDVHDGDPVKDFERNLYAAILGMPLNKFYQDNVIVLAPVLHVALEKWLLANSLESAKLGDARSFMWRACFWDVAAVVASIVGVSVKDVIASYDESFEEYLMEVNHV